MLKVDAKAMGFTTYKGGHYEQNTKDRNGCPQHKLHLVVFFSYEMIASFKTQVKYMTPAQVEVHVQDYERVQSIQAEVDASVVHDDTPSMDQRSYEEEQNNKLAELQTKKNVYTVIFIIVCAYVAFGIGLYIYGMIKDKPFSIPIFVPIGECLLSKREVIMYS